MYLKVPYDAEKHTADPDAVQSALPDDMDGLTVDTDLGYPCVEFPYNAPYSDLERVRQTLQNAGFETE